MNQAYSTADTRLTAMTLHVFNGLSLVLCSSLLLLCVHTFGKQSCLNWTHNSQSGRSCCCSDAGGQRDEQMQVCCSWPHGCAQINCWRCLYAPSAGGQGTPNLNDQLPAATDASLQIFNNNERSNMDSWLQSDSFRILCVEKPSSAVNLSRERVL